MYSPVTQIIPPIEYTLIGIPSQSFRSPFVGLPRKIHASAPMKVLVKNGRMATISTNRLPGISVLTVTQARGTPMNVASNVVPTPTMSERPTSCQYSASRRTLRFSLVQSPAAPGAPL